LLSDGSSDKALIPIIYWVLRSILGQIPINGNWADLARLPIPPRSLSERIKTAIEFYPCDVLFIHRDAENQTIEARRREIQRSFNEVNLENLTALIGHICIIPIRMTEAWLLFDEAAIRKAAGNPNGQMNLHMPRISELEDIPDPKTILFSLLCDANGLRGRQKKRFKPESNYHLISREIKNFTPLLSLNAFEQFRDDSRKLLAAQL